MEWINHPLCNTLLKPAPGTEDHVGALPVAALQNEIGMGLFSFWKPDAEELAALNAGHAVVLGVHSAQHPAVSMAVTKEPA